MIEFSIASLWILTCWMSYQMGIETEEKRSYERVCYCGRVIVDNEGSV